MLSVCLSGRLWDSILDDNIDIIHSPLKCSTTAAAASVVDAHALLPLSLYVQDGDVY